MSVDDSGMSEIFDAIEPEILRERRRKGHRANAAESKRKITKAKKVPLAETVIALLREKGCLPHHPRMLAHLDRLTTANARLAMHLPATITTLTADERTALRTRNDLHPDERVTVLRSEDRIDDRHILWAMDTLHSVEPSASRALLERHLCHSSHPEGATHSDNGARLSRAVAAVSKLKARHARTALARRFSGNIGIVINKVGTRRKNYSAAHINADAAILERARSMVDW